MKTADLCDHYFNELMVCETQFYSYGGKKTFSGPITTVRITENDNEIFMNTIETAAPGSVIVLDGVLREPCAWMGDRKAGIAADRGIAGIIINGFVRDIEGIAEVDMGVMAVGTHPCPSRHKANKNSEGERDVTLSFGNINWIPGYHLYADADGIVVSKDKIKQ
ncbi:ribonuclease E activity regulator RraA [Oceanobacillus saliphilus]|uniref:ribonuclease E activity regulator RraA n=1 Tax=Oceanobacillus saliphilus TaxID=2925834 RepID=UPI00201DD1D3